MKDYYKIMGIPKNAVPAEVKKAYFGLVRKFPPDRYPKEFMQIREAYEVLIDENTRKQYDLTDSMPDIVKSFYEAGREALELGDPERAIRLLERVIQVYDGFSVVNCLLGDAYYKNDNSGKATAIFEKLAKDEPNNAGFAGKLAHAYLKRGWHKKAVNQFRRALFLDEDNISLWVGLIDSNVMANDYFGAREIALEALETSKRNGWDGLELYYHLIQSDIIIGDSAALNTHLEEMRGIVCSDENEKSNIAWFLANIGKMLLKYNDPEKAEKLLNTAFELAPGDKEIREIKEKARKESRLLHLIEKLRSDKSYNEIFAEIIEHEINKCSEPECFNCTMNQMMMEMRVITEYDTFRKQIIRMKTAYPELYQIKKQFFDEVLDKRRIENMYYRHKRKMEKLAKDNPEEYGDMDMDFPGEEEEEYDEEEEYKVQEPARRDENKVGRNDPCPCGSGKKYKKCCGK